MINMKLETKILSVANTNSTNIKAVNLIYYGIRTMALRIREKKTKWEIWNGVAYVPATNHGNKLLEKLYNEYIDTLLIQSPA